MNAIRAAIQRELDSCEQEIGKEIKCIKCDEYRIFRALLDEHKEYEIDDFGISHTDSWEDAESLIIAYEKNAVDDDDDDL